MSDQAGKKEHLVAYSIRLKRDQAEFLKNQKDAAAFIREALDAAILACSAKSKEHEAVLVNRRIRLLQKQIERLRESEEYKDITARLNSDDIWSFCQALLEDERLAPLRHDMENLKVKPIPALSEFFQGPQGPEKRTLETYYDVYHPSNPAKCITITEALSSEDALQKAKQKIDTATRRLNDILERNPNIKSEYEFLKKTKSSYDEEIARLEKEIQELKNKVIEIQ